MMLCNTHKILKCQDHFLSEREECRLLKFQYKSLPYNALLRLMTGSLKKKKIYTVSEFNEFELSLKSAKNRIQLSAGLNLETMNTSLDGVNHI